MRPLVALVLLASCTRTVYRDRPVPVPTPPCRSSDAPRPAEGAQPFNAAWVDWFALELLPWVREVERACPKAAPPREVP